MGFPEAASFDKCKVIEFLSARLVFGSVSSPFGLACYPLTLQREGSDQFGDFICQEVSVQIQFAVQRGNMVYVYGEQNQQLFAQLGQLHGYTGFSVSIRRENMIFTYDARGSQVSATLAL